MPLKNLVWSNLIGYFALKSFCAQPLGKANVKRGKERKEEG